LHPIPIQLTTRLAAAHNLPQRNAVVSPDRLKSLLCPLFSCRLLL